MNVYILAAIVLLVDSLIFPFPIHVDAQFLLVLYLTLGPDGVLFHIPNQQHPYYDDDGNADGGVDEFDDFDDLRN